MYKISIIIPIFNVEKYIERSLNSILNQTMDLKEIEVIMVDDKSTDNTRSIIKEYEKKYHNFKAIYKKENSGCAAIPRNMGINISTGEYLMFLDPDDEYSPDMCEKLYEKIKHSTAKVVKCNHKLVFENQYRIDYNIDKNISEIEINSKKDFPPISASACNAIHNRTFIIENNITFPNLNNGEDAIFSMCEFFKADKIILFNNYAGYLYYTNPDTSHSRTGATKNLDTLLETFYILRNLIEKNNRTDIFHDYFSRYCFEFFIRLLNYNGDKKVYFKQFYEFEKSLNCTLTFKFSWMNIVNKFLMQNRISTAVFVFNSLNFIRKTPIIKIYRKLLFKRK